MTVRSLRRTRRGTIVPMLALCIVALFAFTALAVDLGMLAVARTECQNAADTAALAGCRALNDKPATVDNDRILAVDNARAVLKENVLYNSKFGDANIVDVRAGVYYYDTSVTPNRFNIKYTKNSTESWSAIEVIVSNSTPEHQRTFFARVGAPGVMGISSMSTGARALAVHRPRDVAMVLDYTGSMGYDSTLTWPTSGAVQGLMNPDPAHPKFGHYGRYVHYQNTSTSGVGSSTIANRPNPLQMKGFNGSNSPNNHTMETGGGPPIVEDFLTAPGDPATISASTTFNNAFKMWNPALITRANTTTLTPAVYNWSGYNAFAAACPAPDNFDTQSDSPVAYVGDKWPRTDGGLGPNTTTGWQWSTVASNNFTDNGVKTLKDFLNYTTTGTGGRILGVSNFTLPTEAGYQHPAASTVDGGTSNSNYRDAIWEAYGYDLDVKYLRDQTTSPKIVNLRPAADRFKGYSMGPGYWGKTFFVWPPDPRWGGGTGTPNPASLATAGTFAGVKDSNGNWVCDWRRRFFLRGDGAAFDPQVDNINTILFRTNNAHVLNAITTNASSGVSNTPGYYRINYAAVMAWLKSGPQVLPTNLRAGRLLYYSTMPDDLFTTSSGNSLDRMFWREYVHYIFGVGSFNTSTAPLSGSWSSTTGDATQTLAGVEDDNPFDTNSSRQITAPAQFDPNGSSAPPVNPKPYMAYDDEVNRPRAHFWFGPHSMVNFLELKGENRPWWAGTVREAQCWQLKAAVNSALDDIRNNHPNDFVGIAMFANRNEFSVPAAPMSQDWFTLKNVLFFKKAHVAAIKANPSSTVEDRPYNSSFSSSDTNNIPNGSGSTDPLSGMAIGFNLLSSSTSLPSADYGTRGRRGAAKIVIFETDGVPNTTRTYAITGTGVNTRYTTSGSVEYWTVDNTFQSGPRPHAQAAIKAAERIAAAQSETGVSGYSTPSTPARVYAIGYGYLFDGYNGSNFSSLSTSAQDSLRFLLRVQQVGNTSGPGDPPTAAIPFEQVSTGPYQRPDPTLPEHPVTNPPGRIEKMRLGLERIMQSGVQVTLVE